MQEVAGLLAMIDAGVRRGDPNPAEADWYGRSKALRQWRGLMPTAAALRPAYDPRRGAPGHVADAFFARSLCHFSGSIGVRSRAG